MTPIIILHGALGAKDQFVTFQKMWSDAGYDVHSINFSGHGKEAGKNSFGIETFASDLREYLQHHQLAHVDIFGYSMGGYVALWYALCFPGQVRSIFTLGTKFDWSVESAQHEVKKLNADKIQEKIPAFARLLEARHGDWRLLLRNTAQMMATLGKNPLLNEANLATLEIPVLIGLGELDDMADRTFSERVAGTLPRGRFLLLKDTPHPIEKVNTERLTRLCIDFFSDPEKS